MSEGGASNRSELKIAVIGAGVVGIASAEHLRRVGATVTVFDPAGPAGETSAGAAGLVVAPVAMPGQTPGFLWEAAKSVATGGAIRMDWRRLPGFAREFLPWLAAAWRCSDAGAVRRLDAALSTLAADAPDQHRALAEGSAAAAHVKDASWMWLYSASEPPEPFSTALRRELGADFDVASERDLRARDPYLNPRFRSGLEMRGLARIDDPAAYIRALASRFEAGGGRIERLSVQALHPYETGVALMTNRGVRQFDQAVVATGAWSDQLLAPLGLKCRILSERGYHVEYWKPAPSPPEGLIYGMMDSYHVIHGMSGRLRVTSVSEPAPHDAPPNRRAEAHAAKGARRLYPTLTAERETRWMGRRPTTPDGLPLIGRLPQAPRVLVAAGHQHYGLTLGPRTGRLIADLVVDRRPNFDLSPFRVDRFG